MWSCIAHIITGMIGSGVLSLAWAVAQIGWIAGPASLLCFAVVTCISVFLLEDCYRSPHPLTGARNPSYRDAVRVILGRKHQWQCALFQYQSMYGVGVAYVINTSICLRAIKKSNCYHKKGHEANCIFGDNIYMVLFGGVQLIVSQIPDFHNMTWFSVIAAIMFLSYASIRLGLGLAKVIETGTIKGSVGGVPASTVAKKLWLVLQALGDIAYSYSIFFDCAGDPGYFEVISPPKARP